MSKPFRFTAEHFGSFPPSNCYPLITVERAIEAANAALEAEEAKCERVHLSFVEMEGRDEVIASSVSQENDTHTALLWNVAPIGANASGSEEGNEK